MVPQVYNFTGPDPKLDMLVALIAMGTYPNVCMHKEKRKVLTTEAKNALIHKSSVNCSRDAIQFPVPYFVFGEKIRTRAVSCKNMTMVSPLHLMILASRKVELLPTGIVRVDNWINLNINPEAAAAIVALRPAIESLVIRASEDPENVNAPNNVDDKTIQVVRQLCKMNAGRHGMEQVGMGGFQTRRPPRSFQGTKTKTLNETRFHDLFISRWKQRRRRSRSGRRPSRETNAKQLQPDVWRPRVRQRGWLSGWTRGRRWLWRWRRISRRPRRRRRWWFWKR